MYSQIDFHTHSTASDGSLSPSDLVVRAHQLGVTALALTDHDCTDGLDEAATRCVDLGVRFVPGVEISVTWARTTVHVLGLGIRAEDAELQQGLRRLRDFRDWRGAEMGRRMTKKGHEGVYERALELAGGQILSRTHFGRAMIERGKASDVGDAIRRFFKPGRPGYVAGDWGELEEVVGWIRGAGGVAVLAHPLRYGLTGTKRRLLMGEFQECGGLGLELYNGAQTADERRTLHEHAQKFGFHCSAGSDFHTPEYRWTELGALPPLPEELPKIWESFGDRVQCAS